MSLTVAFQMDPMETLVIGGDSSFALMLEAQKRGHAIWHYLADDLTWQQAGAEGRLTASARRVTEGIQFAAPAGARATPVLPRELLGTPEAFIARVKKALEVKR